MCSNVFSGSSKVFNFVKGFLRALSRRFKCCLKVLQRILNDYYRLLKGFSKRSKPVKGFLNVFFRAFFSRSKALQKLFKGLFLNVIGCLPIPPLSFNTFRCSVFVMCFYHDYGCLYLCCFI